MKIHYIFLISLFIFVPEFLLAQVNLIRNPSFEDGSSVGQNLLEPNCSHWLDIGVSMHNADWYDDKMAIYSDSVTNNSFTEQGCDMSTFKSNYLAEPCCSIPNALFDTNVKVMKPASGERFAGLNYDRPLNHIGVQQQLAAPLYPGTYILKFKYAFPGRVQFVNLEVFLSNSKNDYDDRVAHITNVANFGGSQYVTAGSWYEYEAEITVTDNDRDWILFRNNRCSPTESDQAQTYQYVFLDDISLVEKCNIGKGCSNTAGEINATLNGSHNENAPLCISNLNNVGQVTIRIKTSTLSVIRTIGPITNPHDMICWDGKTDAGVEAASAGYYCEVILVNDCRNKTLTFSFVKKNANGTPTNSSPYFNYMSADRAPKPCCDPDLWIHDKNLNTPKEYVSPVKVTGGPNLILQMGANVLFQAGNEIAINEPFEIQPGAVFETRLQSCMPPLQIRRVDNTIDYIVLNQEKADSLVLISESGNQAFPEGVQSEVDRAEDILLYPNPSSKLIKIKPDENIIAYKIFDIAGRIVVKGSHKNGSEISVSALDAGSYYIKVIYKNQTFSLHQFSKE